ncbi:MAG: flavodoxin family protein [Lachnospira sp.]
MKVLMINGSRRQDGCTYTALSRIGEELATHGIESEIVHVGIKSVNGEVNDIVKEVAEKAKTADGFIVGSPVYYASPSGEIITFLDRLFGVAGADLRYKPAAAVASARRGGTTATIDVLYKYFSFNQMPIVSSNYWAMVHGNTPEEVVKDEEGMQMLRVLGKNFAWLLECIEAGRSAGINAPDPEDKIKTNFIR